eukprot:CAMPEP_0195294868 /NCGR_PEP_ID=MMETSP0707-20130614/16089_1 /TAXON_ID=33640 /ORGANISM="Asterionellopsis glacialis, Strain CCMP134" /LENGTH=215 /DNA_ID=CAMNT_0040355951 /DNA_START=121 /DNA_END=765 /DNA_ORIENTATION=+
MSSIITESNNKGVEFLIAGQLKEAHTMFNTALEILRVVSIRFEEQTYQHAQSFSSIASPSFIFKHLSPIIHQAGDFIHNQAVTLIDTPIETTRQRSIVSSSVLYNLALLFQVSGLEKCHTGLLRRSMKVYEMARDALLQDTQENMNLVDEDASIFLLIILTINNMGQLYDELADPFGSKKCFELVWAMLEEMGYLGAEAQNELRMLFTLNAVVEN